MASSFLTYWYFHLPNFLLAALMYTLLGRVLLALIVQPDSSNYIWRFFCQLPTRSWPQWLMSRLRRPLP